MMTLTQKAKKLTAHYAVTYFVYYAAFAMLRAFISVFLLDKGFSYTQVGVINAIHMTASAVCQPYFSQILSRFPNLGLSRFAAAAAGIALICAILLCFIPASMATYLPIYILFGLFQTGLVSLMVSIGMEYVNAGLPMNVGIGRGVGSFGYAFTNTFLGMLIVKFGSGITAYLNAALLAVLIVLLLSMPTPASLMKGEDARCAEAEEEPADKMSVFMRDNAAFTLMAFSSALVFFGHCVVNVYLPDIAAQFGLDSDFTGIALGITSYMELIPLFLYAYVKKYIPPLALFRFSMVMFSVKVLIACLATGPVSLLLSCSMQIGAFACYTISSIYFTNQIIAPRNRVTAQGLLGSMIDAGFVLGSLVGGVMLDHTTLQNLLWLTLGVSTVGSILTIWFMRGFKDERTV